MGSMLRIARLYQELAKEFIGLAEREVEREQKRDGLALVNGVADALAAPKDAPGSRPGPSGLPNAMLDEIAAAARTLGPPGVKRAIRLAQHLAKKGVTHRGLLLRFVRHFVAGYSRIGNEFAYYNPGADGFEAIRASLAGRMGEEEGKEFKAAEKAWLEGGR